MKKINIFRSSSYKKRKTSVSDSERSPPHVSPSVVGGTLVRIVAKKEWEKLKWEKEQEEFKRRKRQHDMHLLSIEKHEVEKREEELRSKKEIFDEKRRVHKQMEDELIIQVQNLNRTLDEYKSEHKQVEENLEGDLAVMTDCLKKVKNELENRVRELSGPSQGSPLQSSSIKGESSTFLVPCSPRSINESSLTVSYPKLPMSDELLTLMNSSGIVEEKKHKQNRNRRSLNTNDILFQRSLSSKA